MRALMVNTMGLCPVYKLVEKEQYCMPFSYGDVLITLGTLSIHLSSSGKLSCLL